MNRWFAWGVLGVLPAVVPLAGCGIFKGTDDAKEILDGIGGTPAIGGRGAERACTPGATQRCVGPGACDGGQACLPDGSGWSACECGAVATGGSASGGGGNGSTGGSNGGSVDSGGSLGSGGSGELCPPPFGAGINGNVISDFEGATPLHALVAVDGGSWMAETDGTGSVAITVEDDALMPGNKALHFSGSTHTVWGGDVAVMLKSATQGVNTGPKQGVKFRVRGSVVGGGLYAKLQNSDSLVKGCGCDPSPTAPDPFACYGGYISMGSAPGATWQDSSYPFSGFGPSPFGYHAKDTVEPSNLLNMAIVVQNLGSSVSWDLWIDDVAFY